MWIERLRCWRAHIHSGFGLEFPENMWPIVGILCCLICNDELLSGKLVSKSNIIFRVLLNKLQTFRQFVLKENTIWVWRVAAEGVVYSEVRILTVPYHHPTLQSPEQYARFSVYSVALTQPFLKCNGEKIKWKTHFHIHLFQQVLNRQKNLVPLAQWSRYIAREET